VTAGLDRIDEGRWAAWQRRVAAAVDAVIVCSDTDRARLGVDNAVVIPNGYEPPDPLPSRPDGRAAPRFTMVARCTYGPNIDAAWFFADSVFPRIRATLPDAEFRIVGAFDFRLAELTTRPGVTLTGEVPDPAPELAATDVVVTPVRFGSGTRIKVIEAFAHRIPVVSTTLGCEGLGVVDGVHALVADDAARFATACTRLLEDRALAARLTTSAHALFCDRYQAQDVQRAIVDLARATVELPTGVTHANR
jgi:glycosyltransferase involved in cell wall biosynthesis